MAIEKGNGWFIMNHSIDVQRMSEIMAIICTMSILYITLKQMHLEPLRQREQPVDDQTPKVKILELPVLTFI